MLKKHHKLLFVGNKTRRTMSDPQTLSQHQRTVTSYIKPPNQPDQTNIDAL